MRFAVHFAASFVKYQYLEPSRILSSSSTYISLGNAGVIYTPFSFFTPSMRWSSISSVIMARSWRSLPSGTSSRYINTVTNGACPLVVISVITWYCIICTPRLISSFTRSSATSFICSSVQLIPDFSNSSLTWRRNFMRLTLTKGARCASEMLCPPYCELAIWAILWVAILHAVEKLLGVSIIVSLITVPFCSISSRLTRQQLCICWAK